ncbi:MAG TPA: hypothetical protein VFA81_04420 [Burkholderiales bacterium]|nr:hypothetical protein [Burkholderiales bacterium]
MSSVQLTDGRPVPDDRSHTKIRADGQQEGYVVLTPEERAKGFVKPVRRSYLHVGASPLPAGTRDLTPEDLKRYGWAADEPPFIKYVEFPPGSKSLGRFFTKEEVERAGKRCGAVTTMALSIAETYARNPRFYSGTFCCRCGAHFDLKEFTWEPDGEPMGPSLQEAWHQERAAKEEQARADAAAELERRERAELARLKAKYDPTA